MIAGEQWAIARAITMTRQDRNQLPLARKNHTYYQQSTGVEDITPAPDLNLIIQAIRKQNIGHVGTFTFPVLTDSKIKTQENPDTAKKTKEKSQVRANYKY